MEPKAYPGGPGPVPGQWAYFNLGYHLSSMVAPASRVLGPIDHPLSGCMVEFTMTLEDPEAGEEEYTAEELAHFDLFKPLIHSTDTAVFSSSIPRPIEELRKEDFGEGMVYVGMLHDILRIVPYAERPATPSSTRSGHEDAEYDPSVYEPIPADPSHEVTKALVQKLGLFSDVPIFSLYFVSQSYVQGQISGQRDGERAMEHNSKANAPSPNEPRRSRTYAMDGNFIPNRPTVGESEDAISYTAEEVLEFCTGG